jgi:proline iminopeptidase
MNPSSLTMPFVPHPERVPDRRWRLAVGDGHELQVEEHGPADAPPTLALHGGPGSGMRLEYRWLDPKQHRVIRFDQRGCGASTPLGSLSANTTWHSVADIECLRLALGITRWRVFGYSWGSTLALAYAQTHPHVVSALVLQGLWLFRRADLHWQFGGGGMRWLVPDGWARYIGHLSEAERADPMAAYHARIHGADGAVARAAAAHWNEFEAHYSSLVPDFSYNGHDDPHGRRLARARILTHYAAHGGWFDSENHLLDGVARVRHIPAVLIHSRYDLICPFDGAWALHQAWPEAHFDVRHDGGHLPWEGGNLQAVMAALQQPATA